MVLYFVANIETVLMSGGNLYTKMLSLQRKDWCLPIISVPFIVTYINVLQIQAALALLWIATE